MSSRCSYIKLSSSEAKELASRACNVKSCEREILSAILDSIPDYMFHILRVFYNSHVEFVTLSSGSYYEDFEEIFVYKYLYETRPLDEIVSDRKYPIVLSIIEVTNSPRKIFSGYRFVKNKDETLLRFSIGYKIKGVYREANSLEDLIRLLEGLRSLRKYVFEEGYKLCGTT